MNSGQRVDSSLIEGNSKAYINFTCAVQTWTFVGKIKEGPFLMLAGNLNCTYAEIPCNFTCISNNSKPFLCSRVVAVFS